MSLKDEADEVDLGDVEMTESPRVEDKPLTEDDFRLDGSESLEEKFGVDKFGEPGEAPTGPPMDESVDLMSSETGVSSEIQEIFDKINFDLDEAMKVKPENKIPEKEVKISDWIDETESLELTAEEAEEVAFTKNYVNKMKADFQNYIASQTRTETVTKKYDTIWESNPSGSAGESKSSLPDDTLTYTEEVTVQNPVVEEMFGNVKPASMTVAEMDTAAASVTESSVAAADLALGRAVSIAGGVATAAAVVYQVYEVANEIGRMINLEKSYSSIIGLADKMGKTTTLAMKAYNNDITQQNNFVKQYYKYVQPYSKFGLKWKKSEAPTMPVFTFEDDWDKYSLEDRGIHRSHVDTLYRTSADWERVENKRKEATRLKIRHKIAEMLVKKSFMGNEVEDMANLLSQKDYWGHYYIRNERLKELYLNTKRSYDFQNFMKSVESTRSNMIGANKAQDLLGIKDPFLLDQFRNQSVSDPSYKRALENYTKQINAKRRKLNEPLLDIADVDSPGFSTYTTSKDATANPQTDFWAIYFKANKAKFMNTWLSEIAQKRISYIKNGRRLMEPPKMSAEEEKQLQEYNEKMIQATSQEMEIGKNREIRDGHRIIRKGVTYKHFKEKPKPEMTAQEIYLDNILHGKMGFKGPFIRKARKPKKVAEEKNDAEKKDEKEKDEVEKDEVEKDSKDKKDSGKITDEDDGETITNTYTFRNDNGLVAQENNFDRNYHYNNMTALKMCKLSNDSYNAFGENEENAEYEIVEIFGQEGIVNAAQGRMFYNKSNNEMVISFRGTDQLVDVSHYGIMDTLMGTNTTFDPFNIIVNSGFHNYLKDVIETITAFIDKYNDEKTLIYTTGHSLGAIPSVMLSIILNQKYDNKDKTINYNFGSPRGFQKASAHKVNELVPHCYRIADEMDLVASLPFVIMNTGFFHVGKCHLIQSGENYAMMRYISNEEEANNVFQLNSFSTERVVKHKMDSYTKSLLMIINHTGAMGHTTRTEKQMINEGKVSKKSKIGKVKDGHDKILLTKEHAYRHTGHYYQGKRVYQQASAEHLRFIPHYHQRKGLTMTPIPTSLKEAIIGVYLYKEGEFKGSGSVKALVVY